MEQLWGLNSGKPKFKPALGEKKTDVLIIGGGISGILCAYMLDRAGVDYILVEAKEICSGITLNTTAKVTSQHGLIYSSIEKKYGTECSRMYYEANQNALKTLRRIAKDTDCDFKDIESYIYSVNDKNKLLKELQTLKRIGADAELAKCSDLPIESVGAIKFRGQAQFHPLKFLYTISQNLKIFENTKVLEIKQGSVKTDKGRISANRIIIATHFPIINKHGLYFMKMYQSRSYVLAVKNAVDLNGVYLDENETGFSFRNYKDLLLIGGGSHRTGKDGQGWKPIEDLVRKSFPNAEVKYRFATQDCVTLDGIPYIGKYSKNTDNLYVITGFNKWGMTSSMVGAILLSDMIQGRENRYFNLFSPQRSVFHPQLAINAMETITNMINPKTPRCPHLGCALTYNKYEHSWDCPCHGSRFTEDGKLIDNPATDDKKHSL